MNVQSHGTLSAGGQSKWPRADDTILKDLPTPVLKADFLKPLEGLIDDLARANCVPRDYIVHGLLAVAGSLLSGRLVIRPFPTLAWKERPILWSILIGNPSSRKSVAYNAVTEPLNRLQRHIDSKCAEIKRANDLEKVSPRQAADRERLTGSRPEMVLPASAPLRKDAPRARQLYIHDTTIEAVCDLLADNPEGILLCRDEIAGFLDTRNRYHQGSTPFWMEGYVGGSYSVARRGREEKLTLYSVLISMIGTIQPDLVEHILSGPQDGGVARMLFVWPDMQKFARPETFIDRSDDLLAIYHMLNRVTFDSRPADPFNPREIHLEPDAADRFERWIENHDEEFRNSIGHFAGFLGKAAGTVLRVALIAEFLKACVTTSRSPKSVTLETLDAVIEWMDDYMKPMTLKVLGGASIDRNMLNARALLRYLASIRIDGFNKRGLMRQRKTSDFPEMREIADAVAEARPYRPRLMAAIEGFTSPALTVAA